MRVLFSALVVLTLSVALFASPQAKLNEAAPDFTLTDSNGKEHSLSDFKGKYVVLEWINFGCPFVQKHYGSGNMQALQEKYTGKDVVWLAICSSSEGKQGYYPLKEINPELEKRKFKATAYLIDESGEVGKMYAAKTTPHMYIINPDGILLYNGAIDDKPSTNKADIKTANNYVSTMLDNLMAGKKVESQSTTPYGCSVKYK